MRSELMLGFLCHVERLIDRVMFRNFFLIQEKLAQGASNVVICLCSVKAKNFLVGGFLSGPSCLRNSIFK